MSPAAAVPTFARYTALLCKYHGFKFGLKYKFLSLWYLTEHFSYLTKEANGRLHICLDTNTRIAHFQLEPRLNVPERPKLRHLGATRKVALASEAEGYAHEALLADHPQTPKILLCRKAIKVIVINKNFEFLSRAWQGVMAGLLDPSYCRNYHRG
ncbi:hypothetical protein PoMZ_12379 [Pyricularia oryzae]|uniref:Uncharacterized protein n=1 Tax=Pyricularia oryzae TaxID=318829 RepID=A0A4P7NSS4_PYROR|nr:hypothetical protein PoMZ_12379 [Pyricularia oryzae]